MTALHDLSATELRRPLSRSHALAGRGDAGRARPHRRVGAAPARDLRARRRGRARGGARLGGALAAPRQRRRERRRARRRADDDQGEHRHRRHADAARHRARPSWSPRVRDAPPAARLREAGAVILGKTTMPDYGMLSSGLSSFHGLTRNPWDLTQEPGRQQRGRRRRRRRRLRAAPSRHRHRRLGAPAGRLVRHLHAEAEPRPHPDRSAVRRPRRRADDAHRRRRGADDGRARPARRPRHDEPAGADDRVAAPRARPRRPAHRLAARHRRRPAGRRGGRRRRSRRRSGASRPPAPRSSASRPS